METFGFNPTELSVCIYITGWQEGGEVKFRMVLSDGVVARMEKTIINFSIFIHFFSFWKRVQKVCIPNTIYTTIYMYMQQRIYIPLIILKA